MVVIAKPNAAGVVSLYNYFGSTRAIADVIGWYSDGTGPQPAGGLLTSLSPTRILDTGTGVGTGGSTAPLAQRVPLDLKVTGAGGVPASGVSAVVLNVSVIAPTSVSAMVVYPSGTPLPGALNFFFPANAPSSMVVIAKPNAAGVVSLYNYFGSTRAIADVIGWYS